MFCSACMTLARRLPIRRARRIVRQHRVLEEQVPSF
jgi:hypothetical protein